LQARLQESEKLKGQGTEYFRTAQWEQALQHYESALAHLPKRSGTSPSKSQVQSEQPSRESETHMPMEGGPDIQQASAKDQIISGEISQGTALDSDVDVKCKTARAVLNGNIGACYVKLNKHSEAVKACSDALLDDPTYIKVLQRRAYSNERLNTWTSLTQTQDDLEKLLGIIPSTDSEVPRLRQRLTALKPRLDAAQQRETTEMMGKLKELGNSFLGNFGLSTENFRFDPNGQGGYSMNFTQ